MDDHTMRTTGPGTGSELKAPPGTLERRVQILEAAVGALLAERGGPQALNLSLEDGPWPEPPPPPPPPSGGDSDTKAGG